MSYTPINWQTGDVITAEKLNKMDNGWGVENVEVFSDAVETELDEDYAYADILGGLINSDTITVSFEGTDYVCNRIDVDFDGIATHSYGGITEGNPDFSEYPFLILSRQMGNSLLTQNAGTYDVAISVPDIVASDNFKSAVNDSLNGGLPILCVSGVTTYSTMMSGWTNGQILYFVFSSKMYIITSLDIESTTFMPENSSRITFPGGIFTVGI